MFLIFIFIILFIYIYIYNSRRTTIRKWLRGKRAHQQSRLMITNEKKIGLRAIKKIRIRVASEGWVNLYVNATMGTIKHANQIACGSVSSQRLMSTHGPPTLSSSLVEKRWGRRQCRMNVQRARDLRLLVTLPPLTLSLKVQVAKDLRLPCHS